METLAWEQANAKCCLIHSPWEAEHKDLLQSWSNLATGAGCLRKPQAQTQWKRQTARLNPSGDQRKSRDMSLLTSCHMSSSAWWVNLRLRDSLLRPKLPNSIFIASTLRISCHQVLETECGKRSRMYCQQHPHRADANASCASITPKILIMQSSSTALERQHPKWALGTQPWSSAPAVCALTAEPSLRHHRSWKFKNKPWKTSK